jgi:DeoR/GlpR family transcriptional regulator of sugar metabolism
MLEVKQRKSIIKMIDIDHFQLGNVHTGLYGVGMTVQSQNPAARRLLIQRQLVLDGAVSVEALSKLLGVSLPTVRRDLARLEKSGSVRRTHGGATVEAPRGADQAFAIREQIDTEEKRAIARAAFQLLEPDSTVLMNDGSTIYAVAREIVASNIKLTAVTPGVNIACLLAGSSRVTTYLLGGTLRQQSLGTSGTFAEHMLQSFNADIALIAAEGFTISNGLTYSYESDASLARLMHQHASRTVVLATQRKLTERDRICALQTDQVHTLITGCQNGDIVAGFRESGLQVISASNQPGSPVSADGLYGIGPPDAKFEEAL